MKAQRKVVNMKTIKDCPVCESPPTHVNKSNGWGFCENCELEYNTKTGKANMTDYSLIGANKSGNG